MGPEGPKPLGSVLDTTEWNKPAHASLLIVTTSLAQRSSYLLTPKWSSHSKRQTSNDTHVQVAFKNTVCVPCSQNTHK